MLVHPHASILNDFNVKKKRVSEERDRVICTTGTTVTVCGYQGTTQPPRVAISDNLCSVEFMHTEISS